LETKRRVARRSLRRLKKKNSVEVRTLKLLLSKVNTTGEFEYSKPRQKKKGEGNADRAGTAK